MGEPVFVDYVYPDDKEYITGQWGTMTSGTVSTMMRSAPRIF